MYLKIRDTTNACSRNASRLTQVWTVPAIVPINARSIEAAGCAGRDTRSRLPAVISVLSMKPPSVLTRLKTRTSSAIRSR